MAFSGTYYLWYSNGLTAEFSGGYSVDAAGSTLTASQSFVVAGGAPFTYGGLVNGSTTDFVATLDWTGEPFVFSPNAGAYDGGVPFPDYTPGAPVTLVCFVEGTRILTDRGEVAVEDLRAGDLVATLADPAAPFAPVLWIGHRKVRLAGHPQAQAMAPIRIRAGALAENTPHRDLLVSPDHCLLLDGALVPARLLVNGASIVTEQGLAEVTYYHIELARHDAVLAEGAAAESWLDAGNRAWFQNSPVPLLHVSATLAAHATTAMTPCAPLLLAGPGLGAIRDRLALRAAALPAAEALAA
jgi:hypothetical protein